MVSYLFVPSVTKAESNCRKLSFYRRSGRQRGSTPSDRSAAKDISMHAKLALHGKKDNKWQFTSFLCIKDVLVLAQKAPTGRFDPSNIVPDISRKPRAVSTWPHRWEEIWLVHWHIMSKGHFWDFTLLSKDFTPFSYLDPFQYFVRSAVFETVNQFKVPYYMFHYVALKLPERVFVEVMCWDTLCTMVSLTLQHNSPAYKRFGITLQYTIESIYC